MERYRVLWPPSGDEGLFLDRTDFEPVRIAPTGHDPRVEDLRPGYLVEASLHWTDEEVTVDSADDRPTIDSEDDRPTVDSVSVVRPTLYAFADGAEPMFEAATETWERARRTGDGMASRTTKNTDGEVNGVLYTFAESTESDRFEEFRHGRRPIDPLLDRIDESQEPAPREAFVLRPASGEFVAVTIALRKGGRFADTIRDTYDLPRPSEPLVEA